MTREDKPPVGWYISKERSGYKRRERDNESNCTCQPPHWRAESPVKQATNDDLPALTNHVEARRPIERSDHSEAAMRRWRRTADGPLGLAKSDQSKQHVPKSSQEDQSPTQLKEV